MRPEMMELIKETVDLSLLKKVVQDYYALERRNTCRAPLRPAAVTDCRPSQRARCETSYAQHQVSGTT